MKRITWNWGNSQKIFIFAYGMYDFFYWFFVGVVKGEWIDHCLWHLACESGRGGRYFQKFKFLQIIFPRSGQHHYNSRSQRSIMLSRPLRNVKSQFNGPGEWNPNIATTRNLIPSYRTFKSFLIHYTALRVTILGIPLSSQTSRRSSYTSYIFFPEKMRTGNRSQQKGVKCSNNVSET